MVNWLSLPITGTKGLPSAAFQVSITEESIWRLSFSCCVVGTELVQYRVCDHLYDTIYQGKT